MVGKNTHETTFMSVRRKLEMIDVGLVAITAGLTGLGLWSYTTPTPPPSASPSPYPTVIPWLNDQVTCEKTKRSWHDDQCWDSRHDPNF
jgi:hypothetical protein